MERNHLSVREIEKDDIANIIHYWLDSDPAFLEGMGVDLSKIPAYHQWEEMLNEQLSKSYQEKKSYCLIWLLDGKAIGHSNVNKIIFSEEAYMHLHIWNTAIRKKEMGTTLVKMSLPWFFKNLSLKKIYCEPYSLNPAPNKTLEKVGFEFVKTYITKPGWLNFEQPVNLWVLTSEKLSQLTL